ncbi:ATP-binding protein [Actinoplanes utahensis]|uniref:ATP-binding protein n=1 Tax=Actinoplanes utahensis TaxID=1869 RepID=UPI0006924CC7|nr:ATP-binding protein [Actinoplanes utahensis]GIF29894.1 hypothetical protein Aut01nite_28800 [Actinoplanes utahensis]
MTGPSITVVVQDEALIVDFTVHGVWDRDLRLEARAAIAKAMAQHPAGVLFDLRGLTDPGALSASTWLRTAMQGEQMDPPVRVAACLPADTRLAARLGMVVARRLTPVFPTVPLARSHLTSHRLLLDQVRLHLPPDVSAAARARFMVTAACEEWGMPRLVPRARLVASELVANAVEHAGTWIDVLISRRSRGAFLHLAVVDRDPVPPWFRGHRKDPITARGYGLMIVDTAAHTWGTVPTRVGKMVWAMLRADEVDPA